MRKRSSRKYRLWGHKITSALALSFITTVCVTYPTVKGLDALTTAMFGLWTPSQQVSVASDPGHTDYKYNDPGYTHYKYVGSTADHFDYGSASGSSDISPFGSGSSDISPKSKAA